MRTYYIYVLIDPTTQEERYVGQTINLKERFREHCSNVNDNYHKNNWIKSLKTQELKPIIQIIDQAYTQKDADILETIHIAWRIDAGYRMTNIIIGGSSGRAGTKHSEETKQQMSITRRGEGNAMYGRKHSDESKRKNKESHIGRKYSEETKEKQRQRKLGRKASIESRQAQSMALKGNQKLINSLRGNLRGAKLDEHKIREIREYIAQGLTDSEIACIYSLKSQTTVHNIRTGKNWGWVL